MSIRKRKDVQSGLLMAAFLAAPILGCQTIDVGEDFSFPEGVEQVTSAAAHLVLIETIPLAEAVDQPDMNFESPQGQPTWSGQSSISHDQVDAAQSPPLDDDAFASFATQLQGPGSWNFTGRCLRKTGGTCWNATWMISFNVRFPGKWTGRQLKSFSPKACTL